MRRPPRRVEVPGAPGLVLAGFVVGAGAVAFGLIAAGCGSGARDDAGPDHAADAALEKAADSAALASRRAEVAARGALVMPFDLERTTHVFTPTVEGGVQTVVADDADDREQVRLVREHLSGEAGRFRRGDFADPAAIHGDEMPGLAELREGASRIRVEYADVPAGGRIRYSTGDPALARVLHAWFAAQRSDHGAHAHQE